MAGARTVEVTVDPDTLTFQVETSGYVAKSCDKVHEAFAELGEKISDKKKPEYTARTVNLQNK